MIAGDAVEILARGQRLVGPERVIPATAGEPVASRALLRFSLDALEHFVEGLGAGEVNVELGLACAAEMDVGVVEAGHDESAVEILSASVWSGQALDFRIDTCCDYFAVCDGDCRDDLWLGLRVI